jgi:DNA recombination protein RmuC
VGVAAWLAGVVGVLIGAVVAAAVAASRTRQAREARSIAERDLAVRNSQLVLVQEALERERAEREMALANLESTFEGLSGRILAQTAERLATSQEQVQRERESKLELTLRPLTALLDEYKRNLADLSTQHAGALADVKVRAGELLEAQRRAHEETARLNALLGRSSQRGQWGEFQLQNVMEVSGLRRHIDYELQVTGSAEDGLQRRPDCVVRLPQGATIAVDAKFPFAAFEAALREEDPDRRAKLYADHAEALRKHVRALREKSYWELLDPSPEFVVCFVPSDAAITAAFDTDPELFGEAANHRVLVVGPTNLLSLLWSVALVVRQHLSQLNTQEILEQANRIVDRIRLVAEPVEQMGRSLEGSVKSYNKMVASFQSRLLVTAQTIRHLGGAPRAKEPPELDEVHEVPSALARERWAVLDDAVPEELAGVVDAELDDPEP